MNASFIVRQTSKQVGWQQGTLCAVPKYLPGRRIDSTRVSLEDPFVLESNQSGHPSSVSGDRIARCKRWIEREILKPSRLLIAFSMMFWLPRKKISSKNFIYKHAITNNAKQIESFSLTAGTYLSHISM